MGFEFEKRLSGGAPTVETLTFRDTETLTKGDIVNLEAGLVDLGATVDTNLLGVVLATKAGTAGVSTVKVIIDDDAIYAVADANVRRKGDTLDLAGTTGAQGVAASVNREFVVQQASTAAERTRVRFNVGRHHFNKATT